MALDTSQQDRIFEEGKNACRAPRVRGVNNWALNPYPEGSDEYDLWLGGYEYEAESMGSQGKDW